MTTTGSIQEGAVRYRPGVCETCGSDFNASCLWLGGRERMVSRRCNACIARQRAAVEAERLAERRREHERRWADICPIEFRLVEESGGRTDIERLSADQPLLASILAWQYGPRGLLLHGPTGRCKTRCAWRLLRREYDRGRCVQGIKAHRFGVEAQHHALAGSLMDWLDALVEVPLLLLDDMGKGRFTDASEAHLFALIDERSERGLPLIITTNDTEDSLRARMSDGRAEPLMRRLADYCDVIPCL